MKELKEAQKVAKRWTSESEKIASNLKTATAKLAKLETNMGPAAANGHDLDDIIAEVEHQRNRVLLLKQAQDIATGEANTAKGNIAKLQAADNERQAIDNLKKARKHIATIDGLAAKLDNERTALATLTKDTSRLLGRFGSVNSKVSVMRSAWQTLETFNRNWAIAKKHDSNYAQNWTDA